MKLQNDVIVTSAVAAIAISISLACAYAAIDSPIFPWWAFASFVTGILGAGSAVYAMFEFLDGLLKR